MHIKENKYMGHISMYCLSLMFVFISFVVSALLRNYYSKKESCQVLLVIHEKHDVNINP
jgi:hypothetical protein